jgi:hypothetical protein
MTGDDERLVHHRIPADVDRPDVILLGLTGRQALLLGGTGLLLWVTRIGTQEVVPAAVFLAVAAPVSAAAFALAVGRRDGMSLDAWLLAALQHARRPHRLVGAHEPLPAAPTWVATTGDRRRLRLPAPLRLPASGITSEGIIDLPGNGQTMVLAASTVSFDLRTPGEQHGLISAFGRWLNSLDGPVQLLIRARRVDLSLLADQVVAGAAGLPHPALEAAACSHAAFLDALAADRDLLHRHITLAVHEARAPQALLRRAHEAIGALSGCEVTARLLDGAETVAYLAEAMDPQTPPPPPGLAGPQEIITAVGSPRTGGHIGADGDEEWP